MHRPATWPLGYSWHVCGSDANAPDEPGGSSVLLCALGARTHHNVVGPPSARAGPRVWVCSSSLCAWRTQHASASNGLILVGAMR